MWDKIKSYFDIIQKYSFVIITGLMILFMILYFRECRSNHDTKVINNQNVNALLDSIRFEKAKNGNNVSVNTVYSAKINDLEKLNKNLYDNLNKETQKNYLLYAELQASYNSSTTITLKDLVKEYPNDIFSLNWDYENTCDGFYQALSGISNFKVDTLNKKYRITSLGTFLTKNSFALDAYLGIRRNKDNGKVEVTARTSNPDVYLNPIANVDPNIVVNKKDNWVIIVGGGAGMGTKWNGTNGQIGEQVGIYFGYRLTSW